MRQRERHYLVSDNIKFWPPTFCYLILTDTWMSAWNFAALHPVVVKIFHSEPETVQLIAALKESEGPTHLPQRSWGILQDLTWYAALNVTENQSGVNMNACGKPGNSHWDIMQRASDVDLSGTTGKVRGLPEDFQTSFSGDDGCLWLQLTAIHLTVVKILHSVKLWTKPFICMCSNILFMHFQITTLRTSVELPLPVRY